MKKILVVEDESNIVELLKFNLEREGYWVETASDGQAALDFIKTKKMDIVILDLMLPKVDGFDVCKYIRQIHGFSVYIIMLTAKGEETDKIIGLEVGADEYITKPFSPRELLARIKAVFRRKTATTTNNSHIKKGNIQINRDKYICEYCGAQLDLTPKQFALLLYLVENEGKVCTREELLTNVWGYDYLGDSRTVDVHIRQVRQSLERVNSNIEIPVQTIRGVGYRFRS